MELLDDVILYNVSAVCIVIPVYNATLQRIEADIFPICAVLYIN